MCYRDRHTALLILLLAISVQPFKVSKNSQNVAYEMIPSLSLSLSLSLPTSINNFFHLAGITALSSCKHAMLFLQSPFQILERLPAWAGWAFSFCVPAPTRPPACLPACMPACRGGAVANSVVDIVFHSSARDTIACLAKSAKGSIGLLRRHYDICNIIEVVTHNIF